jgi:AmmeMemoRadiSam system protein B
MLIRKPHVAGSFYPSDASELRGFFESIFQPVRQQIPAKAVILPHAGYVYSGKTAAAVVSRAQFFSTVLMIGPNHHGIGEEFVLYPEGEWETPSGRSCVDFALTKKLLARSAYLSADEEPHDCEHSLEVLLPFLQKASPGIRIVPLLINSFNLKRAKAVALDCAEVLAAAGEPVSVAVSTDMNHFESDAMTRQKDRYALQAIENLDEEALAAAVKEYRISMCGFVPVYMLLLMRSLLGFHKATLVDYRTSGDVTGDTQRVVGYAGFIFE